ncbi:MAG TPA: hypothetical protein VK509_12405, partial [Polyangiales bacterium]|nr:hypothetical protein [Polyangiales bacterium]
MYVTSLVFRSSFRARRPTASVLLLPVLACFAALVAAGCSSNEASAKDGKSAGGELALPALPDDPVALVPAGASMVVTVELASLRGTPLFDVLKRWAAQQSCGGVTPGSWLVDRAERIVVAGFERAPADKEGPEMRSLLIVRAPASAGDAARLLAERAKVQGQPEPVVQETTRGRFAYAEANGIAAARLGDHLLAIGDAPVLAAALDVADGKQPAWPNGDPASAQLLEKGWLTGHSAGLIGRISERGAKRMKRALSKVGAGSTPLDQGALTFSLDVSDGLRANAQVGLPDPASADRAAGDLKNSFGQLDLILRLTGLPSALANPEIHTEGKDLKLSLTLSADDVRILLERLD